MRTLLKVHEDVHTVPEAIRKMMEEYTSQGYETERLTSMNFKIVLQGGWVHIFWEDGRIWQEIIEEGKMVAKKPAKVKNGCGISPFRWGNMEEAADNRGQQKAKQPSNGADILDDLVVKIVPLLVKGATEALQIPKYGGLEFATMLLEEALKYGELYPRAFAMPDKSMYEAVKKLRQWNAAGNHN